MEKIETEISIILSVPKIWERKTHRNEKAVNLVKQGFNEFIDELDEVSKQLIDKYDTKVDIIADKEFIKCLELASDGITAGAFDKEYIKFSTIELLDEEYISTFVGVNEFDLDKNIDLYVYHFMSDILEENMEKILLCLQLAKPGVFSGLECFLIRENKVIKRLSSYWTLTGEATELALKYSWPPVKTLPVTQVLEWLFESGYGKDLVATSKLSRAIAAFSHVNDSYEKQYVKLIWALIGLETLYCKGISGLKAQLLEKSELFLGERVAYKKSFSKMYDYRSRLVHGDLDIPYSNSERYDDDILRRLDSELYEYECIAISMLLSTLQNMCRKSINELNFSYKFVDTVKK